MNSRYSFIIACLLSLTCLSIKGQDTLKSFANSWGTELNINPFDGSLSLNNSNGQIKLRRFYNNNKVLRIAITINYLQDNSNTESPYGTTPINDEFRRKSLLTIINIGTEKHFSGSRRVSPYIGWEAGFGFKSSKQVEKDNSVTKTIKGAWSETVYSYNGSYYYHSTSYTERGFWSLSANFVAGFDFYMTKDFYFGYEMTFGIDYKNYSNIDITPAKDPNSGEVFPNFDDESWRFGPKLINGIRIGYIF